MKSLQGAITEAQSGANDLASNAKKLQELTGNSTASQSQSSTSSNTAAVTAAKQEAKSAASQVASTASAVKAAAAKEDNQKEVSALAGQLAQEANTAAQKADAIPTPTTGNSTATSSSAAKDAAINQYAAGLASGSQKLATGLGQLNQQVATAMSGTAGQLAQITLFAQKVSALNAAVNATNGGTSLKDGVNQLTSGVTQYTSGVDQAFAGSTALNNGLGSLNSQMPALQNGISQIVNGTAQLAKNGKALTAGSSQLANGTGTLNGGLQTAANGVNQLTANTGKLTAAGNKLNASTGQLSTAGNKLNSASGQLNSASGQLTSGAGQLSSGLQTLNSKVPTLTSGVNQLADGSAKLDANSNKLMQGTNKLKDGSGQLASSLKAGADQINSQPLTDRTAAMFAAPTKLKHENYSYVPNYGHALAPYVLSVALYVGALVFNFAFPIRKVSMAGGSVAGWYWSKLSIGAVEAFAMAVIEPSLMMLGGLTVTHPLQLIILSIAFSEASMFIVMFLSMLLDNPGRFIAMVLLMLQLGGSGGTFPMEVTNHFYNVVHPFLPMTYSILGFRQAITDGMGSGVEWQAVGVLALFAFISMALLYPTMRWLQKKHLMGVSQLDDNQKLQAVEDPTSKRHS